MNKKKQYGFPEEVKKLFRIEWKTITEIHKEVLNKIKKDKK
jgi:hypothetical protein